MTDMQKSSQQINNTTEQEQCMARCYITLTGRARGNIKAKGPRVGKPMCYCTPMMSEKKIQYAYANNRKMSKKIYYEWGNSWGDTQPCYTCIVLGFMIFKCQKYHLLSPCLLQGAIEEKAGSVFLPTSPILEVCSSL